MFITKDLQYYFMSTQNKKEYLESLINSSLDYLLKIIQFQKTRIYDYLSNRKKSKYKFYFSLKIVVFIILCIFIVADFKNTFLDIIIPLILILSFPFINIGINETLENYKYIYIKRELKKIKELQVAIHLIIDNRDLFKRYGINFDKKALIEEITEEVENLNQIIKSKFTKFIESKGIGILGVIISILIFILQIDYTIDFDFLMNVLYLSFIFLSYFFLDDYLSTYNPSDYDFNKSLKRSLEKKLIERLDHNLIFFRNLNDTLNTYPNNTDKTDVLFKKFIELRQKEEKNDETLFKYFY